MPVNASGVVHSPLPLVFEASSSFRVNSARSPASRSPPLNMVMSIRPLPKFEMVITSSAQRNTAVGSVLAKTLPSTANAGGRLARSTGGHPAGHRCRRSRCGRMKVGDERMELATGRSRRCIIMVSIVDIDLTVPTSADDVKPTLR